MDDETGSLALGLDVDLTRTITFHGITYVISLRVRRRESGEEVLLVEAEQQHTDDRWTGEFTRQYVEEITTKTGNFKKFGVFVRMLLSALQQRSDSVFADLLTYSDLELLRARKLGQTTASSSIPRNCSNKRYLILTYAVEFDRVHYPLPLVYDENPGPDALKRTIKRLKEEIRLLGKGGGSAGAAVDSPESQRSDVEHKKEMQVLQKENSELRLALRKQTEEASLNRTRTDQAAAQKFKQENEALRRELHELEESYEELRENSAQEIRKLRRESKDLVERLKEAESAAAKQKKAPAMAAERENTYRRQIADLEAVADRERAAMRRLQAKHKKEMADLVKQLEKEVSAGRVLRSRNRDLQRKAAVLQAQVSAAAKATKASGGRHTPNTSGYNSRANSTISSRFSSAANSRASSAANSRASSRAASRTSSRDNSPRCSTRGIPRGRMDTSKLYSTYDEHGVNLNKARGRGPSPGPAAGRTSPAASERKYVSPYSQSVRPPSSRRPSSVGNGYLSAGSEGSERSRAGSRASRASGTSRPSATDVSGPQRRGRQPKPSPPPRARQRPRSPERAAAHLEADVLVGRPFRSTETRARVPAGGTSLALPERPSTATLGGASKENRSPPDSSPSLGARPRPARHAWGDADTTLESNVDPDGSFGILRPLNGARRAASEEDDKLTNRLRSDTIPASRDIDFKHAGPQQSQLMNGHAGTPKSASPVEDESPKDKDGDFDATSEIGEIDRRLSALQNFLKAAKNGIITRIPPASGSS